MCAAPVELPKASRARSRGHSIEQLLIHPGERSASKDFGTIAEEDPERPPSVSRSVSGQLGTELLMRAYSSTSDALRLEDLEEKLEDVSRVYMAVFKLFVTHAVPNYQQPWAKQQQTSSIGTGFAIDVRSRRFLTNAHCVDNAVVVQVLKRGDTKKYFAKLLCIGDDCDLALMTVEAEAFWEGVPDIAFGQSCRLQDTVNVIGYPVGGQNLAITQGVVSRIDLTEYSQSFSTQALLTVQIDAAINPGNSGGPVLNAKLEVVGVAFQKGQDAENTGYIIPITVVERFLEDYTRHGTFTGFCTLGIEVQDMENDALRELHTMEEHQTGVLIRAIVPESDAASVLQVDDVLLSVEDSSIGNDGTVEFLDGERILVTHLINSKFRGDRVSVQVLRGGKVLDLSYKLENPQLIYPPKPHELSYFIVAGLVFIPCSLELLNMAFLLKRYGDYMVPAALRVLEQFKQHKDEEAVVLNNILRNEINAGYSFTEMARVKTFNGQSVRNLRHLVDMVEKCTEEWSIFEFHGTRDVIVFRTSQVPEATKEVLKQNMIPAAKYLEPEGQAANGQVEASGTEAPPQPVLGSDATS